MKIFYTILFFIDTLLLILLSFILLKMIDEGVNITKLIFMLSAIILSIVTLIFFLRRYLKVSASGSHNWFWFKLAGIPSAMTGKKIIFYLLAAFIAGNLLLIYIQYNSSKNINTLIKGNEKLLAEFHVSSELKELEKDIISV